MQNKIFSYISILSIFCLISFSGQAQKIEKVKLTTKTDSFSYAIGLDIGKNLKAQSIEVSPAALARGILNATTGEGILFTDEMEKKIMTDFQKQLQEKQKQIQSKEMENSKAAGTEFLARNKMKEGVIETESGLQYKVITKGTGASPIATDTVTVHYKGTLIDGTKFDASYDRGEPATFPLNRVISGWTEGLQLMKEGAKYIFYIPSELGYGERGAGQQIPGGSTLIFEVELIKVSK